MASREHYTFGTSARAAERLALLAQLYAPSSARLLASTGAPEGACALDLGCGPGYTTELLHTAVRARETWGLDASALYVDEARTRTGAPLSFAVHDVTRAPYPVPPVDVAYTRYLVTHLADVRAFFDACAETVRPGGSFVLEENCALTSEDALLSRYYAHVEAMQRHYGQDMFVGERLPALAGDAWRVARFERTPIVLDAQRMALLHAMNVRTWRSDPFAAATFAAADVDAMTRALDAIASGDRAAAPVTVVMGQLVLERR
jgi:trans-aconitate methyltransferase